MVISAPAARAVARELAERPNSAMPNFFVPASRWQLLQARLLPAKRFEAIGDLRTDMGIGRGDEIAPAPDLAGGGIVRQRADFRHGPDRRRGLRQAFAEPAEQRDNGKGGHAQRAGRKHQSTWSEFPSPPDISADAGGVDDLLPSLQPWLRKASASADAMPTGSPAKVDHYRQQDPIASVSALETKRLTSARNARRTGLAEQR